MCPRCGIRPRLKTKEKPNGSGYCSPCLNEWQKERAREVKKKIDKIKSVPCMDCGKTYHPFVMDFDHTSDDKLFNVSRVYSHSWSTIQREIEKCDVVCSNCHRLRTLARYSQPVVSAASL